jgi:hypothetical protein
MAKEASSSDSSLQLHEVLEAEFVALHGELPPNYPSSSEPETRLKGLWTAVHGLKEKRAALCISGGGIRSATFGLGVLQGLARCGLLDKFHYLSTVSGGGYIGSWLSAWIKNDPRGINGVVAELRRRPDSTLAPEPRPIRHLRDFSNYLAPKTGFTSVDSWTLITTFIRNMFLNWLVLISWLAAAMMIPRLYLAAISLQPNWPAWDSEMDLAKYMQLTDQIKQFWDFWLNILVVAGFVLIAVAMAYAIIDVPSTGNAGLSQRRFLKYRQLPLVLAALILAAWWAVFCSVHGGDAFNHVDGLIKFLLFFVGSYICGGLLGSALLSFRKQRVRSGDLFASLRRLGTIVLLTAIAGFCMWAMATRMFLDPPIRFTLKHDCDATPIPWSKKIAIPAGTQGVITQIERNYIIKASGHFGRISENDLGLLELDSNQKLPIQFTLKRESDVTPIRPWSKQKIRIPAGTQVDIEEVERRYTIDNLSRARAHNSKGYMA